jgi:hypothetical protein
MPDLPTNRSMKVRIHGRCMVSFVRAFSVVAVCGVAIMVASACTSPYGQVLRENGRDERLWDGKRIENYGFTLDWTSERWPPEAGRAAPVMVQVRGGAAQSITYSDTGDGVPNPGFYLSVDNFDKLFALVREMARLDMGKIAVQYDDSLGYPRQIIVQQPDQKTISVVVTDFEIAK